MKNEPLIIRGAVVAAVNALLGLLVSFGVNLTPDQMQSINTFIDLSSIAVLVAWGRSVVTPVKDTPSEEVIREVPEGDVASVTTQESFKF